MQAVRVKSLVRVFRSKSREVIALNGIDLSIESKEIFGLLGANGAGKTTLVKILSTLLLPTSGEATVYGYDVVKNANEVRKVINLVSGGETPGYGILTAKENLWFFSQLYGLSRSEAKERIELLMHEMELDEYADIRMHKLSTGYKQRLNLARGFINDPKVLFLDEPTLGLDVLNARHIRDYVKDWAKRNDRAVLLTTHYMAEAEEICDRVAIIYNGRIIACETPEVLKASVERDAAVSIEIRNDTVNISNLSWILGFSIDSNGNGITKIRALLDDESRISDLVSYLSNKGYKILSIKRNEPTLEDAYIKYVGRGLE